MKTTLNKILACDPCHSGWEKLLKHLGKDAADDEPLDLLTILESNGLDDALWALRAVDGFDREKRLFAVWCARQVQHLGPPEMGGWLDTIERYANGKATDAELAEVRAAAEAAWAARDAEAAWAAAWDEQRAAQKAEFRRMIQEGYP
jgi:hypothetical protein